MKTTLLFLSVFLSASLFGQKNLITKTYDKYEEITTYRTPLFGKGFASTLKENVSCIKTAKEGEAWRYYLSLSTYGATVNVDEKGVIILFSDGTKLKFPQVKIDVEVSSTGYYEYSAFVPLSNIEVDFFETKVVEGFKLGIYEGRFTTNKKAIRFKGLIKQLKDAG